MAGEAGAVETVDAVRQEEEAPTITHKIKIINKIKTKLHKVKTLNLIKKDQNMLTFHPMPSGRVLSTGAKAEELLTAVTLLFASGCPL